MSGSHVWRFKNNLHGFLALPLTSTDSLGKSQLFDFVPMIFYYYIIDTECHALYPGLESLSPTIGMISKSSTPLTVKPFRNIRSRTIGSSSVLF